MSLSISFSRTLSNPLFLSLQNPAPLRRRAATVIRMGGGPRTYPGGVSKWQWKRMQAKKSKQLLKARLCRERQIYEMRKRAELKAAVAELERPWEVVERAAASNLFSVSADEQLKVLADRFQKPGGFDMWTDRDGPQLFETPGGVPSARFFPKGVVHSVKPYGSISGYVDFELDSENDNEFENVERNDGEVDFVLDSENDDGTENGEMGFARNEYRKKRSFSVSEKFDELGIARNGNRNNGEVAIGRNEHRKNGLFSVNEKFGELGIGWNENRNNGLSTRNGKSRKSGYPRSVGREGKSEDADLSEIEDGSDSESRRNLVGKSSMNGRSTKMIEGRWRKNGDRSKFGSGFGEMDSRQVSSERKQRGMSALRSGGYTRISRSNSDDRTNRRTGSQNLGLWDLRNSRSENSDHRSTNRTGSQNLGLRDLRVSRSGNSDGRTSSRRGSQNSGLWDLRGSRCENSDGRTSRRRGSQNSGIRDLRDSRSEIYDMRLQQDGSYGF